MAAKAKAFEIMPTLYIDDLNEEIVSDIKGKDILLNGYLFIDGSNGMLFKDISSLIAYDIRSALFVDLTGKAISEYQRYSLCHVTVKGNVKFSGFSRDRFVLFNVGGININEVLKQNSESLGEKDYKCFLRKQN